jgi:hypothetical protein
MKFNFLQRLSAFFNGFLLSSTAFQFSSTDFQISSTAFLFPRNLRKSIYGSKYTKDHHSSFVFPATRSPSFVIATRSLSFVIATRSPSFVIATMLTSHPTPNFLPVTSVKPDTHSDFARPIPLSFETVSTLQPATMEKVEEKWNSMNLALKRGIQR